MENMGEDKKSEGKPVANAANKCVFYVENSCVLVDKGSGDGRPLGLKIIHKAIHDFSTAYTQVYPQSVWPPGFTKQA